MAVLVHAPLTIDEFSRLPREGGRHEMSAGELITMAPPRFLHSRVVAVLFGLLRDALRKSGTSEAFAEAGYILSHDPLTIRQPDVSVLSKARISAIREDQYAEGAPELAVEVVSPSDSGQDLEVKVDEYLTAGAKQVWILYPKTKHVHVFYSDGAFARLGQTQTLSGGDLMPDFSAVVADLFV